MQARSRRTAAPSLVNFDIRGDKDKAADKIGPVLHTVAAAQAGSSGLRHRRVRRCERAEGVETAYGDDLAKAGTLSLPITLIILVLTFGALVAAGIPLLLALTAVFATFGLIALTSHLVPVAIEAEAMVLLIGLAVGIDYSMFYLTRARQERAAGRSERAALEAAAATSGRSVLISGLTVIVAMAGMFLTGDKTFASFAFATILVVARRGARLADRAPGAALEARRQGRPAAHPVRRPARRDDGEGRIWGSDRRPRPAPARAVGGRIRRRCCWRSPRRRCSCSSRLRDRVVPAVARGDQDVPPDAGRRSPARHCPRTSSSRHRTCAPAVHKAIAQLEQRALASGRAYEPITVDVNKHGTVANITLPIEGSGTDAASNAVVRAAARDDRPRDRRRRPEHRGRRHRADGLVERLRRPV